MKKRPWVYYVIAILTIIFGGTGITGTFMGTEHMPVSPEVIVEEQQAIENQPVQEAVVLETANYYFRNKKLLEDHYEKHGIEMGFDSAQSYERAANEIINHPDSLHRIEEEDGDDVYYLEENNGFVIVSVDGYIRTFFYPEDGLDYFNRQ